jgi:hypothetical protein
LKHPPIPTRLWRRTPHLHERLPRSKSDLLDAGHFIWEDAADQYAARVTSWWAGGYAKVGRRSGHTDTFTRRPDGTTDVDAIVVREGKNLKGWALGLVLGTVGRASWKRHWRAHAQFRHPPVP